MNFHELDENSKITSKIEKINMRDKVRKIKA